MSEIATTTSTPSTPNAGAAQSSTSEPEINYDNPSGAESSLIVKKAEAAGKTVKQFLADMKAEKGEQPKDKRHVPDFKRPKAKVEEPEAKEDKPEASLKEKTEAAPEKKEPVKEEVSAKKWKVTVNGKETEVDEKELLRGYAHRQAADRVYNEGKMKEAKMKQLLEHMRDPEKVPEILKYFGHDPNTISENIVYNSMQEELLTPEQKQARAEKRELEQHRQRAKAYEEMEKQKEQEIQQQRIQKLAQIRQADLESEINAAFEQVKLPKNKHTINKIATYMYNATQMKDDNGKPYKMTASEAAQLVKEDIDNATKNLIGDTDGEMLLSLLSEDQLNKVLKARNKKVINPNEGLRNPQKGDNSLLNRQGTSRPPRKRLFED